MVKGISRRVVVIDSPDQRYFEQAIFLVRNDAAGQGVTAQELVEEGLFFQVVRASFAQRRKTLLNGLTSAFGSRVPKDDLRAVLAEAGLPENVRGETLGIPQFAALAAALSRRL